MRLVAHVRSRQDVGKTAKYGCRSDDRCLARLIRASLPVEIGSVAIRRQTVALLCLPAGVALLGMLHHRPRAWVYSAAEVMPPKPPDFYAPTPAQAASTFAQVTAPKGFRRASLPGCGEEDACFHDPTSVILSVPLVDRWATEAGLTVDHENAAIVCPRHIRGRPGRIRLMGCGGVSATLGRSVFDVIAHSLVITGRHGIRPTNVRVEKIQGTELLLADFGVPNVDAIRKQQAELAKEGR